jgi:protein-tyrosine phosphatase
LIDLHSHILPGVDDGAENLAAAVEMARSAVEDGIEVLAATPHVRGDYPTTAARMEERLATTRAAIEEAGIPLRLLPGAEIALDRLPSLGDDELHRLALGGSGRALLVEFPYTGWPLGLDDQLFRLRARGFRPVLAHPERNAEVQARPERLRPLVEAGTLVQLTAASVDGRLRRSDEAAALKLLELELAHLLASDAHAPSIRQIGMSAAAEAIGDEELARWLTLDVPRALVEDERVPRRPETRTRKHRLPWRRN